MEDVYSFGAWMRYRRKVLGLTRAELANSVGVATVTIRKIETDERRPYKQAVEEALDCLAPYTLVWSER